MNKEVPFRTKHFAIGSRAEHRQEIINRAQWGVESLKGVKAAEYRLTTQADGKHPVYTFCMCPGGVVVPATAYADTNIVNGMSYYQRNGEFANAACVAGIHPDQLAGRTVTPTEALDELESVNAYLYSIEALMERIFDTKISNNIESKFKEIANELAPDPLNMDRLILNRLFHQTPDSPDKENIS